MKVLIALDHKPSSQAIIDALIKLRWFEATELHVITVSNLTADIRQQEGSAIADIEDVAVALHDALSHCEVSFLCLAGDPKTVILNAAAQLQADLIVLGSNCKNTLERLVLGSVAQSVMNSADCPVIIAKAPCCLAREASPGFRNILIPVDNSKYSDIAISWLANFDWNLNCKFIIAAPVDEDTDMHSVAKGLTKRASLLSKTIISNNIVTETIEGDSKSAILALAKKYYSDLIVMGSHGRTGLRKLLLGSVADAVIHDAPCAVAVVRGLAADSESWVDTGAYPKFQPVHISSIIQKRSEYMPSSGISAHVMPGGM